MFCGLRLGSRRHKSKKHANATAVAGSELDNDTTIVATAASQNGTDMKENHNPNVIRTGTRDTFISAYGDQTKQPLPDDCGEITLLEYSCLICAHFRRRALLG